MPLKLTRKQDAFALAIAQGMNTLNAAKHAGYVDAEKNAYRLTEHDGVKQAVEQYRSQFPALAANEPALTPEFIMRRTAQIATQSENLSAATAALRLGADITGMLEGRHRDLPDAAKELMQALGEGLGRGRSQALRDSATEVRAVPLPAEPPGDRGSHTTG